MSERKVLNKYYPPDFDPSKIPRMKLPKNRQYTVRLMAPFNMRCKTCGEYIYKGKKFNARKEDVENQDYLGIRIYRFYIKCTRCLQEISFKTDPRNCDYEIEAGATRNFMALKLAEEQAQREENELKEEEANNPMKLLENRTIQSKNEIELLESLEELKDLNKRHQAVDYDSMLQQYDTRLSAQEIEERLKQRDEDYIKTIKFEKSSKRKVVVEEEIIDEPVSKLNKSDVEDVEPLTSDVKISDKQTQNQNWNKSIGSIGLKKKNGLSGIVRIKNKTNESDKNVESKTENVETKTENIKTKTETVETKTENVESASGSCVDSAPSGLLMLGAYSDSESD